MITKDSIVTVDLNNSSSTFIVDSLEESTVLISHPLAPNLLMRVNKSIVDKSSASIKDSNERSIDYANSNKQYLDYNNILDLECVCMFFAFKRKLTPRQKQVLSSINGVIAGAKLGNNVKEAMTFIVKNSTLLDDFNLMWFHNMEELFSGKRPVISKKQRSSIFNIAGYLLAEMENPTAKTVK